MLQQIDTYSAKITIYEERSHVKRKGPEFSITDSGVNVIDFIMLIRDFMLKNYEDEFIFTFHILKHSDQISNSKIIRYKDLRFLKMELERSLNQIDQHLMDMKNA